MIRKNRIWEVDTLRGVAIVLMIFYHFVWDLSFFDVYPINVLSSPWQNFARSIATMFTFVMGISLTLSYNREAKETGQKGLFQKYLWRGLKVFGWGLVITVATYFFIGRGFVIFGILHMLGLSIILAYPFLRLNKWISLIAGLLVIGLGLYLDTFIVDYPWLIWSGVKQAGRSMVDYYPLFPWFGIALLGIFAGYSLYPQGLRHPGWPDISKIPFIQGLRFLGRHSLLIYLIHQPILIGLLFVLGFRP
jgi:uncharacterized membrane protein